ncbi:DUF6953 family protein [Planctomycetota bacterium]
MKSPTVHDVAAFMLNRLNEDKTLYQEVVVYEIQQHYGAEFVYINENGNLAISRKVLSEFQKLTEGKVVWSRGERYWRFKEDYDDPKSRMTE